VSDVETTAVEAIREILSRRDVVLDVKDTDDLFEVLGLDSLEVAELSALLEDTYGSDPYSAGLTPRTVREVVEFYR
jgi:acyl carrier protein